MQGNNIDVRYSAVPEPASILMVASAVVGAVGWARYRRRQVPAEGADEGDATAC